MPKSQKPRKAKNYHQVIELEPRRITVPARYNKAGELITPEHSYFKRRQKQIVHRRH